MVLLDSNRHLGPLKAGEQFDPPPGVGTFGAHRSVNYGGRALMELVERHHMGIVNIHTPGGSQATYYGTDSTTSRIDYICAPLSHLPRISKVSVMTEIGFKLQRSQKTLTNLDHVPVHAIMKYTHFFKHCAPARQWNHTLLRRALHGHKLRKEFLAKLQEWYQSSGDQRQLNYSPSRRMLPRWLVGNPEHGNRKNRAQSCRGGSAA